MPTTKEWFRSGEMEYISIVMHEHCAYRCMSRLGRLGTVQFTDLTPDLTAFQRRYINEVQRCDEMERKLGFFESMLQKYEIEPRQSPQASVFLTKLEADSSGSARQSSMLEEMETLINGKESELQELNSFRENLQRDYNSQIELRYVLEKSRAFFDEADPETRGARNDPVGDTENGSVSQRLDGLRFHFITGTILQEERARFERMVFRSTRGNCLMKFSEIENPIESDSGEDVKKTVFIIFYQAPYVQVKINRICEAFSANLYEIPDLADVAAYESRMTNVHNEIGDRDRVLQKNKIDITSLLNDLAKWLEVYKWTVAREKTIYHVLNHFAADLKGVLRAEGWVISEKKEEVRECIYSVHDAMSRGNGSGSASQLPCSVTTLQKSQWPAMPPTYFETNKFTEVYQLIVDTYGVPRYQEANPAVFYVITFPFLFGVMFGDIGHGVLLFVFSCFIISKERELENQKLDEMTALLYNGRYMLILMGFFSAYCGLLYNDYFAMGLKLFTPTWVADTSDCAEDKCDTVMFNSTGDVYPAGVDPTWHHADNGLLFFNSVKMKMSVIFGVTQMTVGLFLKMMNALHFKEPLDMWFEALPQIIFMLSLFGYMCAIIIYKWLVPWGPDCGRTNCNPPSLITTLINIVLAPGTVEEDQQLYEGQATVQVILLLLAVVQIPLMLIPKPYFLVKRMHAHHGHIRGHRSSVHDPMLSDSGQEIVLEGTGPPGRVDSLPSDAHDEEHSAGDIWIHQAIETIEFCLGCISNTASYLRLWALSLAHSQLATVFLEKALLDLILNEGPLGPIMTFFGYGAFAGITFAVLMVMDNLECFLHALRLHWVEFQSKFYKADGVKFTPVDFEAILEGRQEAV
mmetsp:Transcript_8979/g.10301  ORF Transcript_8979/g.10301 Transcript_8979/m.10301 type:complete len:860 (+) Transcript_8979:48-2627(+)|eukprot:CAMPEP_0184006460 /NCGR_PEP_ID=MMETSP0954-20121128/707_1 /TAXON_ID=627963 /ORGANISM="Aplanochytrium sp, Strain PBS07" /LENGTH=859 /DNA_ID=CAMNT_0026285015 /DNA_START=225 /DNA_END=2804 /DNA_ORIENTATION=-